MNIYLLKKIKKIKYISIIDMIKIIIFIFLGNILKILNKKKIWIINEDRYGANDNGYKFFKFLREKYSEVNVYYIIDVNSSYYEKVRKYEKVINWGSLQHWLIYFVADKIIYTQLGTAPSQLIFALEILGIIKSKRIFLQHGITMNYYESLKYQNTKLKGFICGAKPEYDFIKNEFGYPDGIVQYTGFARFDDLYNYKLKNQIIVMPTWRSWLTNNGVSEKENIKFTLSDFYKNYNMFLENKKLITFIEKNNINIYFYLHREMQEYIKYFTSKSKNIKIISRFEKNIQELIKDSKLMITDYSSVSNDFSYMKKPIIYFQFDSIKFRKLHGKKGYFSYEKDGFGLVVKTVDELVKETIKNIENNFLLSEKYRNNINKFYQICDNNNCERIYNFIKEMK